jgi:hypothetical protein
MDRSADRLFAPEDIFARTSLVNNSTPVNTSLDQHSIQVYRRPSRLPGVSASLKIVISKLFPWGYSLYH